VTENSSQHPGELPADEVLVAALASGTTIAAAARRAGCHPRTVYRRLESAEFRGRVQRRRAELVQRTVGGLAQLGRHAATTLGRLLRSSSETVQLSAARAVLEFLLRSNEQVTLQQQVEELRQQLEGLRDGDGGDSGATGEGP
jgi:AcrR family transcriptional regulator